MEIIDVTSQNIEKEHICCAIASNKDCQVLSKKAWLAERFEDGLVFKKCDVRGKCFIEYIPAEKAWAPVDAPGYMYIDCLWVSGQHKGQGYSNLLLRACIKDAKEKGKKGLVILSADKKRSFLSDPRYLRYKGFLVADTAEPYYELYYLPFAETADTPHFKPHVKKPAIDILEYVLYYTNQCPFTAKYVPLLKETAEKMGVSLQIRHIVTAEQAQSAPAPFTTFSLFYNGSFVTNEILSPAKFEKMIAENRGEN